MNPAAVIAALLVGTPVVIGVIKLLWDMRIERQRNQPVVIAHETKKRYSVTGEPRLGTQPAHAVDAFIRNEGERAAFNIRFGVELHGVRFAYRHDLNDPAPGNRQPVIRPGQRIPEGHDWSIFIPLLPLIGATGQGEPDPGRVYWARYENAAGHTYETRNPANRSRDLDIKRVWFPARLQRREARVYDGAHKRGAELDAAMVEEFQRRLGGVSRSAAGQDSSAIRARLVD